MIDAVAHRHLVEIKRAHACEARKIDTILIGIGAALVMRVDAAARTKIMFGRASVELVKREMFLTRMNFYPLKRRGHHNRATHPAEGAGATPRRREPVA